MGFICRLCRTGRVSAHGGNGFGGDDSAPPLSEVWLLVQPPPLRVLPGLVAFAPTLCRPQNPHEMDASSAFRPVAVPPKPQPHRTATRPHDFRPQELRNLHVGRPARPPCCSNCSNSY